MTDGLQFGFVCNPAEPAEIRRLEGLGIDSLWVGGHVASTNPSPEAMVQLARLSALTERVRIGTSILLLPLYPPAIVAKQIADLDRASGGRVTLGVGVGGEYPQEFRACGIPIAERGSRTDEAIPLIRRLWSADPVSHHGAHFDFEDVRVHPAPAQGERLPIVVSGRRPVAMRRAALLGDGWMPYLYSPRRYADSVRAIEATAEEAGRSLATFEWSAFVFVGLDDDSATAKRDTAAFLGGNYRQGFEEMVDSVAVAGTVAEVTARLGEYIDSGARHLIVAPASRSAAVRVAERLTAEVFPALR